jgi:hypothetical protein
VRRACQVLAAIVGAYSIVLEVTGIAHGTVLTYPVVLLLWALALFVGRGGRVVVYFVPVFIGLLAYTEAGKMVAASKLSVHYSPQITLERWLTPGEMPTLWLQHHLYHGTTGFVEIFAVVMYLSHFWIPLAVGFGLVLTGRREAFLTLMFSILTVSILADLTFVLAPTAPPWLAAQQGYLPPVHHILKDSLADLHLTQLANWVGNSNGYDVTAAIPSLHVAFPVLCLLTAVSYRLPRLIQLALALNILGVIFAILYTGDHYLVDALAGVVYAIGAWLIVRRVYRPRTETSQAGAAAQPAGDAW